MCFILAGGWAQGRPGAVRVEPRHTAGTGAAELRYRSYMELSKGEQSLVAGILYPVVHNEPFLAAVLISAFKSSCVPANEGCITAFSL